MNKKQRAKIEKKMCNLCVTPKPELFEGGLGCGLEQPAKKNEKKYVLLFDVLGEFTDSVSIVIQRTTR